MACKMQNLVVLEETRVGKEKFLNFDLAAFAKKHLVCMVAMMKP